MRDDTIALHAGYQADAQSKSIAVSIYQTVFHAFDSAEPEAALFYHEAAGVCYSRIRNPAAAVPEKRVAAIEAGVDAPGVSAERAAFHYSMLNLAEAGGASPIQPARGMPHSYWNDLPESDLVARGDAVISKSADAGVDTFVQQFDRSLFAFIRTHPEYEVGTLAREHRRDISRFRVGQPGRYPTLLRNDLDIDTRRQLEAIRSDTLSDRKAKGLAILERAAATLGRWRMIATRLYRNGPSYLMTSREARLVQAVS
jgi:hypothetical protein